MQRLLFIPLFILIFIGSATAALSFPTLTGRVVDNAGVLSAPAKQNLDQALEDYEKTSTNQVVVVTLSSLQGTTIEDYGYQLGRAWGIGQKGKDNGVLLIVAPKEHKVRIEVGYGLEGTLTDALSSEIIQGVILPQFRAGQMEQGIIDGTHAILNVLQGKSLDAAYDGGTITVRHTAHRNNPGDSAGFIIFLVLYLIIFFLRFFRHGGYIFGPHGYIGGFSAGGFGGGGGFSGGGGSFGGGGASGGW